MSAYKDLLIENQELAAQLQRAQEQVQNLQEALAGAPGWVSTQDVVEQLADIDLCLLQH